MMTVMEVVQRIQNKAETADLVSFIYIIYFLYLTPCLVTDPYQEQKNTCLVHLWQLVANQVSG